MNFDMVCYEFLNICSAYLCTKKLLYKNGGESI